ncbi:MAG: phosphoadenosine phosphosulfate reductase family protein [Gammaproteobacteria bacterium]|nr:phosphoadenosine phosphosulfate reductase family protein [Gammaproteobacteria bacterium]
MTLACSFSVEDAVVLHLWKQVAADVDVFALDTGRLPEATYRRRRDVFAAKYDLQIRWFFPQAAAVRNYYARRAPTRSGMGWRSARVLQHRKVEPLGRARWQVTRPGSPACGGDSR